MSTEYKQEHLLKSFLEKFPSISTEKVDQLAALIPTINVKKGTVLLEEGEVPKACFFVLKGLVRQYQVVDGLERTTAFYTEKHATVSSRHFMEQSPSTFYLHCSEDCVLISGEYGAEEEHYRQFPELAEITRQLMESDLNHEKEKYADFILAAPKERYLNFMEKRPELVNRVPLHQIASYLGMTAESLSRIRKRIVSSN